MMNLERLYSNGMWAPVDAEHYDRYLADALAMCNEIEARKGMPLSASASDIEAILATGKKVPFGTDWNDKLRMVRDETPAPTPALITADCGHSVRQGAVMNASLGTSCPECYDDMSS